MDLPLGTDVVDPLLRKQGQGTLDWGVRIRQPYLTEQLLAERNFHQCVEDAVLVTIREHHPFDARGPGVSHDLVRPFAAGQTLPESLRLDQHRGVSANEQRVVNGVV